MAETLRVAVAANFKLTLEELSREFETDTGIQILLSSASTGMLANQIQHGAPFDLFFAADISTAQRVASTRKDESFCYAIGRLVLVGGSIDDLAQPDKTLAIANPATAPYGRAAMEVLARAEFRGAETRDLIRGNNAAQAYQFWHSGSTELALVPMALARTNAQPIPANWHTPIEQHAVVIQRSKAAERYLIWLRSDRVRSLISKAGYETCP
jgi:molybdate transport system substrate-binding protein